jgi:hypothetical protein
MKININEFNKNTLNILIEKERDKEWECLRQARLEDVPLEELAVMKTLWSHGFMTGAVTALKMSEEVFTQIKDCDV